MFEASIISTKNVLSPPARLSLAPTLVKRRSTKPSFNLDAGTYMCHFSITPSTDSGQYPNGDPDGWYMRIFRNGSVLVDEAYFQEGGSNTYQQSASQSATFTSNGSDDIYFQVRVTDGDGGGVGGRYQTMVFPIMRQS